MQDESDSRGAAASPAFLAGGGELGALIRAFDWSRTSLGPPESWPQSLKTAVRIMLTSRQSIWIGWGEDLVYLYNNPHKAILGGKHPHALGRPTSSMWQEIWRDIGPMLSTAMDGDEGIYVEEQLLIMERHGYPEETYYTFSYSPIPEDVTRGNRAGGIICANTEDTRQVIGERQIALLRELAAGAFHARSWEEACERSAHALETNPWDVLFAAIYIADPDGENVSLAGGDVVVRVRDTGAGIPPEELDGIFEMFTQLDRTMERSQGGLGIGLTLVQRIVEMHGGSVAAHSEGLGRGSEFVVRLPVLDEPPQTDQDSEPLPEGSAAGRRILVVDDNQDSAMSLAMLLEIGGHEVRTAHDGLEALDVAETFLPDLVLMDLGMPKLNGYDAASRIREQGWGRSMILVAVTGWGQDEDRRRTTEAGFDGHLVKPVDHELPFGNCVSGIRGRSASESYATATRSAAIASESYVTATRLAAMASETYVARPESAVISSWG